MADDDQDESADEPEGDDDAQDIDGVGDPRREPAIGGSPVWLPGFDANFRASLGGLFRELDSMNRLADMVREAVRGVILPKIDIPVIPPDALKSILDIEKTMAPLREAVASMFDWSKFTKSLIDPAVLERIRESLDRCMPPNWVALDDWLDGTQFVDEVGWSVVWVPRPEVTKRLVYARPEEREQTLIEATDSIVSDAIELMADVTMEDLDFLAQCVVEVAESIRDGRARAAQALAASVLTELLQGILGHSQLAAAREKYGEPWEQKSIRLVRFALVTSTVPKALDRFYRQQGDDVPVSFNRHAIVHGASPVQFTQSNALVGLLLVASLVRELQSLYDEGVLHDE